MKLQMPSWLILLCTLVLIYMLVKKWTSPKLPPGPWKLPIIGNLHHLPGALPHRRFRDLAKKYGPIMHLQLGQVEAIVITSPRLAKEVYKTHDMIFASRPDMLSPRVFAYNCTDVVFAPYGEYWRTLRKICILELLNAKRVRSFKPIRESEANDMVQSITMESKTGLVDISAKVLSFSSNIISRSTFGERSKHQEGFSRNIKRVIELASGFAFSDIFPSLEFINTFTGLKRQLVTMQKRIDGILNDVIQERRIEGGGEEKDLLDVLLRIQSKGDFDFSFTVDNLKAVILDIFTAGTETSATTLEWAMTELMRNPKVRARAQEEVRKVWGSKRDLDEAAISEMEYLKLVINENFRLHVPAPLLVPRVSSERIEIDGYVIPEGTRLFVNAWAMGRDPNVWENPDEFEPERFRDSKIDYKGTFYELLPFGAGRRICPGVTFGMATVELALARLLYHFDWELPDGTTPEEVDMEEYFGATMGRKNHLRLKAIPVAPIA